MPTFANLPLENLLEPKARNYSKQPSFNKDQEELNQGNEQRPRHLYISPALYATPEQAPIPEYSSPEPVSPSPYLANHKRRRSGNETRKDDMDQVPDLGGRVEECDFNFEEVVEANFVNEDVVGNDDDERFLDLRFESMSVGSEVEANDFVAGRQIQSRSFVSAQGEFFDANDDFSDGSISNVSAGSRMESELHAIRLSILEETERRKTAEKALILLNIQWLRISNLMNEYGFTFPSATDNTQLMDNLVEQLSQEVVVARFVADAIGRGEARAEAEAAAATIIESKEQDIVRLRDRLQYYETVNHEMSQRKLVEVARRQQERKHRRSRWMWSFVGLSVAIGASFVAYSCIPHSEKYLPSLESDNLTGVSHVDSS